MSKESDKMPLGVKILGWYGIIFSITFFLVAVVNIVLSILDRTYKDIGQNLFIGLYGIPILAFSLGFKNGQKWGWYGYSVLQMIVIGLSIWDYVKDPSIYWILIGLFSLIVLAGILMPSIPRRFFAA